MPAVSAEPARNCAPRPFVFTRLEKLPRSQIALMQRLEWLLPEGLLTGAIEPQVQEGLKRIFDDEVHLWLEYVHAVEPGALPRIVSEQTFLAAIAPSPHRARGLVEVELALAHGIIDLLLGTVGEATLTRPLTEIEEGVLSYVLLETFKALSPATPGPGRDRIRLEGAVASLGDGLELFEHESTVAVIELKTLIGAAAGYLRLLLPGSTIEAASQPQGPELRARRLARLGRNLPRLGSVQAWLRAEIGHVDLSGGDLKALRAGDVILVDSLTARADKGEAGRACLKVGLGRAGRLEATVSVADGRYQAKIEKLLLGPEIEPEAPDEKAAAELAQKGDGFETHEPQPPPVPDGPEKEPKTSPRARSPWDDEEKTSVTTKPEEIQAEGAELLNDVPLHVVVELARVALTADQVLGLHTGQIIDLGRGPGGAVDLSVNGKIVARGELVEIEGQLGVRIASLSE
jgi:flagellar motor switch protein FliM